MTRYHDSANLAQTLSYTEKTELDQFQLQTFLLERDVLIPVDTVQYLYAEARSAAAAAAAHKQRRRRSSQVGSSSSDFSLITIRDLNNYLSKLVGSMSDDSDDDSTNPSIIAMKHLARNINFWLAFLYVIAGVLLMIVSFYINDVGDNDNSVISEKTSSSRLHLRADLYLCVSICYIVNSAKFIFEYPIKEWKAQKRNWEMMLDFKKKLLIQAAKCEYDAETCGGVLLADDDGIKDEENAKLATFIANHIFMEHSNTSCTCKCTCTCTRSLTALTKKDLELLLLKEIGSPCDSRLINNIFTSMDINDDGTISAEEFHYFVAGTRMDMDDASASLKSKLRSQSCSILGLACSVFWTTITDLNWQMTSCFALGSLTSFLHNAMARYSVGLVDLDRILGDTSPGIVTAYFFLVGSTGYAYLAYGQSRDSFDIHKRARRVMGSSVRYSNYYNRTSRSNRHDEKIDLCERSLKKYNGLDKKSLYRLLEERNVIISEDKFNSLFCRISGERNDLVTNTDINVYCGKYESSIRQLSIIGTCFRSFKFWASFSWFVGSMAYLFAAYYTETTFGSVADKVSACCNFYMAASQTRNLQSVRSHNFKLLQYPIS